MNNIDNLDQTNYLGTLCNFTARIFNSIFKPYVDRIYEIFFPLIKPYYELILSYIIIFWNFFKKVIGYKENSDCSDPNLHWVHGAPCPGRAGWASSFALALHGENKPTKYIRCVHDVHHDKHFNDHLSLHDSLMDSFNNNSRILIGGSNIPLDLGTNKVTVSIPMVFHLIDPKLSNGTIEHWTKHINSNIIAVLNTDYNRTQKSYADTYTEDVEKLFANADPSKKNYYKNLVNTLPHNYNLNWNFYLDKIIIKPISKLSIKGDSNENIFKSVNVIDPDSILNIIVVPGTEILGISVFPFVDRNPTNPSLIDEKYKYRNAVLINTFTFLGTTAPYDLYRTFTHEIGHWCGLLHPFDNQTFMTTDITKFGLNKLAFDPNAPIVNGQDQNDVGDLIADTAPQLQPTFGTVYDSVKTVIHNKKQVKVRSTPYASIFQKNKFTPNFYNFMDYTDDGQMCMFSQLQVLKMVYMMARFRPNFVKSE